MLKGRRSLVFGAVAALGLARPSVGQAPLRVAASFSILADLVAGIGGREVAVQSLIPPGVEAHGFQPSPSVARQVAAAELVAIHGLGFDPWLPRLVRSSGFKGPRVVASTNIATLRAERDPDGHSHGEADPHLWQDPDKTRAILRTLLDALVAVRPQAAESFRANAAAFDAELIALGAEIEAAFEAIPRTARRIVTTHDAFAYYGARFGIDFIGAQGVSAETEPSARQIARLLDQIRKLGITAVFLEGPGSERAMRRLADEAGVRIGGRVHADALMAPGQGPSTYVEMMRHNTAAFVQALRG